MTEETLPPLSDSWFTRAQQVVDGKTKPLGSLGHLEDLAIQVCAVQETLQPRVSQPTVIVFAGDHGVVAEGVSAYPQAVTAQMVTNYLAGGAAVNVFAREHQVALKIVDAGVNAGLVAQPGLIDHKVALGTANFVHGPAMSQTQFERCMALGAKLVDNLAASGCNTVGFGEMGIGNTSPASLLMSLVLDLPLEDCVGPGAGLDATGIAHKVTVLKAAKSRLGEVDSPLTLLQEFGGFEMVMMAGAMRAAAQKRMLLLIDGFIVSSVLLVMAQVVRQLPNYCIFAHQSAEPGHREMLNRLGGRPLYQLGMRLGEGSGAVLAVPLVRTAVAFFNEMASFESAGVSQAHDS